MIDSLIEIVGILVALSAAAERLVDIVKGFIPALQKTHPPGPNEARRKSIIQIMAVFAGVLTSWLAWPIIGDMFPGTPGSNALTIAGLGFLVSGGSGLWNSILSYLLAIKNIKKAEAYAALERSRSPAREVIAES